VKHKLMESDNWGTDRTHFYFFAASRIRRASAFRPATADVKDWFNNYQAFEKSPVVTIDAVSVRLEGTELQIDCGLDDYAA
jgi:hypothetical protein